MFCGIKPSLIHFMCVLDVPLCSWYTNSILNWMLSLLCAAKSISYCLKKKIMLVLTLYVCLFGDFVTSYAFQIVALFKLSISIVLLSFKAVSYDYFMPSFSLSSKIEFQLCDTYVQYISFKWKCKYLHLSTCFFFIVGSINNMYYENAYSFIDVAQWRKYSVCISDIYVKPKNTLMQCQIFLASMSEVVFVVFLT